MTHRFARVRGPLPGPRSRALIAREQAHLAPGIQQISTLAGLAVDGGDGALLHDADGNVFIDFVAGIGVASIGHGHPALAQALAQQAGRISATSFASEPRARLLERIAGVTRQIGTGALHRTMLYSGGAEAVESALRLARARTGKQSIAGFHGAFHGKTAGVAGLLDPARAVGFAPLAAGLFRAPWPDLDGTAACVRDLEQLISARIGNDLAAILVEPMQGTSGNRIPPSDFLPALRELATKRDALLVCDEMITGWGRTGRMFAVEHSGVEPDILVFGKGVAGGHPVSGLITSDAVLADADPWTRPSFSSSSYGASPLACAAADAVTRVIVDERLDRHAATIGAVLFDELRRIGQRHRFVRNVRGAGLLLGFDLELPPARCEQLFAACLRRGLLAMVYTPCVRINPPLVISEAQAREGVELLDDALAEVGAESMTHDKGAS